MSEARPRRVAAVGVLASVALFGAFVAWHEHPDVRAFQADSEALVRDTLSLQRTRNAEPAGGFMTLPGGKPYFSLVALQYRVLTVVAPRDPARLPEFFVQLRFALAAMFAATLGIFAAGAFRWLGAPALLSVIALAGASPWLASFAFNAYWIVFLAFLPFVLAWTLHPELLLWLGARGTAVLYASLVFLKSLCGYEYLTNVVASLAVALAFHEVASGAPLIAALGRAARAALAACVGFIAAIAVHSALAASQPGGLRAFIGQIRGRTVGDVLGEPVSLTADLDRWLAYWRLPATVGMTQVMVVVAALALWGLVVRSAALPPRRRAAIALAVPAGLLASLTWNVLARGHMRYHLHINEITFFLPFDLLAFTMPGLALEALIRRPGRSLTVNAIPRDKHARTERKEG